MTSVGCSVENLSSLFKYKGSGKIPILKNVVCFDPVPAEAREHARKIGLTVYEMTQLVQLGNGLQNELKPPTCNSIYTFAYTSGTTGVPKGAMIDHTNCVAESTAWPENGYDYSEKDTHFSYLPMAHIYERSIIMVSYVYGMSVGFS